jgi:imidazolonepropionase-like amidohydrolase
MVEGGLTPMQGIVAATSGSAAALGGLGEIRPGAPADLLVVDSDPLEDPSALHDPGRIPLVLQGGNPVGEA